MRKLIVYGLVLFGLAWGGTNRELPQAQLSAGTLPFEDSAFGVVAGYAANEFGYFKQRAGFSNEDYWWWADEHFKKLGAHWTRSSLQPIGPLTFTKPSNYNFTRR